MKEEAIRQVNDYLRKSEVETNAFGSGLPNYVIPETKLQIISKSTETHNLGSVLL